jgi:PAS domain S-box-containing protein
MTVSSEQNVLIVEDLPETAELERRALQRAGFAPCIATSVSTAKSMLRESGFVAVLLDYNLPDGSAWDVVETANATDPRTPVVLVTAMGSEEVAANALRHGVCRYVRKSETFPERLVDAITQAVKYAQTMQALQHDSSLFRLIADNANDIIVMLDAGETIQYASGASARILGYSPEELIGHSLTWLLPPDQMDESWLRRLDMREPRKCLTKGGREVLLEPTFYPVPDGQRIRTIGILRDVTERAHMEEQLRHQQRIEMIGQMTTGITHDFHNLLQAMMGAIELLLDEVGDKQELRECAESALRMGERGVRLTNHLLAFARKQVLKPEAIRLPSLLADTVQTLRRTLGPQVKIILSIAPEIAPVYADPGQLEAAVMNLVLNARDAMPKGGTLAIAAHESSHIKLEPNDDDAARRYVVLAVADTGEGMSPDVISRACEPFFTTKGTKGSGLGLSMVEGFARQSGGDIRIHSAQGAGTKIEIWLPIYAEATEPPAAPVAVAEARGAAGRVLLVDDEQEVLITLGSFLKGAGFEVDLVHTGDEAFAKVAAGDQFDVLVTDYAMPGLNGVELITQVRALRRGLPILVASGYAEADRLEHELPNVRVMRKPFRRKALIEEVTALITIARARDLS